MVGHGLDAQRSYAPIFVCSLSSLALW
jgi:hypothetical protein